MYRLEKRAGAESVGVGRFEGGGGDGFWEGETWCRAELATMVRCIPAHEDEFSVTCTSKAADVVVRCLVFARLSVCNE